MDIPFAKDTDKENNSKGKESRKRALSGSSKLDAKTKTKTKTPKVKKSCNGRMEDLMAAFEFEVSQALKAVYLDSRYRHLAQYTFIYNYTAYISITKLSITLGEFAFPIDKLEHDTKMKCPGPVLDKARKRLELSLLQKGKYLVMKLPKRPPRFDYARFSEKQRKLIDEYYLRTLLHRLVEAEKLISRAEFCRIVNVPVALDSTALPEQYSMIFQVKLSNGEQKGFLTVPNDCTLGDLEAFVSDSFAKRLGYEIDDGYSYLGIEDNRRDVKEAYNYWLQRLDPAKPQESVLSHYSARLSFGISAYQISREAIRLGMGMPESSVLYGGREVYDSEPKGSLLKTVQALNPDDSAPECWDIPNSGKPEVTLYADPVVCDVFPKLPSTFHKTALDIQRDIGCFSFDNLEVNMASYVLFWRASDISVDLRFVAVEPRFNNDKEYPRFHWMKKAQYYTGVFHDP